MTICKACNQDVYPYQVMSGGAFGSIAGGGSSRFGIGCMVDKCPRCNAVMPAEEQASETEPKDAQEKVAAVRLVKRATAVVGDAGIGRDAGLDELDAVELARKQLLAIDEQLANHDNLIARRDRLRRLVRAADGED